MAAPIYGDESDGSVTISSNTTVSTKEYNCTDFTVESGVTLTVAGTLVVQATGQVVVNGTIDAYSPDGGYGGGGLGGTYASSGNRGRYGQFVGLDGAGGTSAGEDATPTGAGGAGGGGKDGADGMPSNQAIPSETQTTSLYEYRDLENVDGWSDFIELYESIGSGGGGGGGGDGGGVDDAGGDGGDGGDGGGLVLIVSPDVSVGGAINADGRDGQDGQDGYWDDNFDNDGGGGGGGGAGGLIYLLAEGGPSTSGTLDVSGGSKGVGGVGGTDAAGYGGDGSVGADGSIYEVTLDVPSVAGNLSPVDSIVVTGSAGVSAGSVEAPLSSEVTVNTVLSDVGVLKGSLNPRVSDASTEDELTLDWDQTTTSGDYEIYRAEVSGDSPNDYSLISTVGAPPYTDTGLEDGERFYYRVKPI